MSVTRTKGDVTRIDTTHRKGRMEIMGQVKIIDAIVLEVLSLSSYSNVPDGRRYIFPIAIRPAITDIVYQWELKNNTSVFAMGGDNAVSDHCVLWFNNMDAWLD